MLNKNSLAVKKCEANQCYKRPKILISSKAKKLNITKTPFTCNTGYFHNCMISFVT